MVLGLAAQAPARDITLDPAVTFKGQDGLERTLGTFDTRSLTRYDLELLKLILEARGGHATAAAGLGAALAAGEHRPEPSPRPDFLEEKGPSTSLSTPELEAMTDEKGTSFANSSGLEPDRWTLSLVAKDLGPDSPYLAVAGDGSVHLFLDGTARSLKQDGSLEVRNTEPMKGVRGFAAGKDGILYVSSGHAVWKLDSEGRFQRVLGTGTKGSGLDAKQPCRTGLDGPDHLAVDPEGNLFVHDSGNARLLVLDSSNRVRELCRNGDVWKDEDRGFEAAILGLVAGGDGLRVLLEAEDELRVAGVAKDGTQLGSDRVRRSFWDQEGDRAASLATHPLGVLALEDELLTLGVGDGNPPLALLAGQDEALLRRHCQGPEQLMTQLLARVPTRLACSPGGELTLVFEARDSGDTLVVAAKPPSALARMDRPPRLQGSPKAMLEVLATWDGLMAGNGNQLIPAMAAGPDASVLVVDGYGDRIMKLAADGTFQVFAPCSLLASEAWNQSTCVAGLAVDARGQVYVSDWGNHRILRISPDGSKLKVVVGSGLPGSALDAEHPLATELDGPGELTLDAAGDLLIADSENGRVLKLDVIANRISVAVGGLTKDSQGRLFTREGKGRVADDRFHPHKVLTAPGGRLVIQDIWNGDMRILEILPDQEEVRVLAGRGWHRGWHQIALDETGALLALINRGQLVTLKAGELPTRVVDRWGQNLLGVGHDVLAMTTAPDGALVLATREGLWYSGAPRENLFTALKRRETRRTSPAPMPWRFHEPTPKRKAPTGEVEAKEGEEPDRQRRRLTETEEKREPGMN